VPDAAAKTAAERAGASTELTAAATEPTAAATEPTAATTGPTVLAERAGTGGRRLDVAVAGVLALVLIGAEIVLRGYFTRPFWYDEIWRARFVSEPAGAFWSSLGTANTPSAAGWMALTRLLGEVAGWHAWVLRLPEFAALPLLSGGTYLLARRFAGRVAAGFAALSTGLCSVVLDLGTQLKPYGVEAAATVAILALWLPARPGAGERPARRPRWDHLRRSPLARQSAAAVVGLLSVPAILVIVPLAVASTVAAGRRWRAAALRAAPAPLVCAVHTAVFVGHQSGQRNATYWDQNFLAHRGVGASLSFVGYQLLRLVAAAPAGVDQYDPNVAHAVTDGTWLSYLLIAPAGAAAAIVGAVALSRSQSARARGGALVVAAVAGAEILMLAASGMRYWPFGPTRTNLFVVPPLVLLVVVGAERIVLAAAGRIPLPTRASPPGWVPPGRVPPTGRRGPGTDRAGLAPAGPGPLARAGAVAVALVVLAAGAVTLGGALSGDRGIYRRRDTLHGFSLLVDATTRTRQVLRPGDELIVGGRLAESGWIYAMEVSDDGPSTEPTVLPDGAPPPVGGLGPRVGRSDTTFLPAYGDGTATRAIGAHHPRRLIVFLDAFESGADQEVAELRAAGWCPSGGWRFGARATTGTGTLTAYQRCPARSDPLPGEQTGAR